MASAYPSKASLKRAYEQRLPPDKKDITTTHIYEDKGASFNTTGDNAPRRWLIVHGPIMSEAQAAIIDDHFEEAGFTEAFNFTDRYGVTHTNVRYLDYDYPDHQKIDQQTRRVVLIKRPA